MKLLFSCRIVPKCFASRANLEIHSSPYNIKRYHSTRHQFKLKRVRKQALVRVGYVTLSKLLIFLSKNNRRENLLPLLEKCNVLALEYSPVLVALHASDDMRMYQSSSVPSTQSAAHVFCSVYANHKLHNKRPLLFQPANKQMLKATQLLSTIRAVAHLLALMHHLIANKSFYYLHITWAC